MNVSVNGTHENTLLVSCEFIISLIEAFLTWFKDVFCWSVLNEVIKIHFDRFNSNLYIMVHNIHFYTKNSSKLLNAFKQKSKYCTMVYLAHIYFTIITQKFIYKILIWYRTSEMFSSRWFIGMLLETVKKLNLLQVLKFLYWMKMGNME